MGAGGHAWNVKRLRPVELGPFDYENEVYTRSLWVAEGFSDYYAWLLVGRAGLASREETLADISRAIGSLQTTSGRLVQSLQDASYDAWIKAYRPDENSRNTTVSYYTKGSIVGLLLDARIRKLTNGTRSLDDVMGVVEAVHRAGYFDQAHLTRSLGRLIGETPGRIRRGDQQLSFLYKTALPD